MKRKLFILLLAVALVISLGSIGGCGQGEATAGGTITIGSKDFTENIVLAHIMADMIEAQTDLKVNRKVNLGGSNVALKALQNNDIQMFPDYTGTIVANYYQEETGSSEETLEKTRQLTEQDGFKVLKPFGMNNTYTLAVTKETAEKYNLKTFSDLAQVSENLVLGCEFEFQDRPDGYPGLQQVYNMNFKDIKGMSHGIKYRSISEGEVDVVDAYATDGQLKVFGLVILEDDKEFFPPYDGLPFVRQDILAEYPEIEDVLNQLAGLIDDETMQGLNAKVDSEGLKAEKVAHDFLVAKGLIEK
ncbi:MAG: glycine/betaine ABC transporter substrate-binding protein [Peptococcaceae bacterium]|nr:glycine/betaine ABC transporter substrate-binding protein [Peptococcaceae bacterium]